MVSFEPKLRKEVEDAYKNKRVLNCCVKRSRGDKLEILAHNRSSIASSPKKFKINEDESDKLTKTFVI